jgi:hypothetical protein
MAFFSQVSYTDKIYEIFIEKLSIPIELTEMKMHWKV